MKKFKCNALILLFSATTIISCNNDDDVNTSEPANQIVKANVVLNYAESIVLPNYQAAMADAQSLKSAINAFVSDPTQTTFTAAKASWLMSRESYGTTEAFRFANGPIDSGATERIEGLLNSWPLDESFVDYVEGSTDSGIINNISQFPSITKAILETTNGDGGEENVTIGYHAIEFLLWGQDNTTPSANLKGQRAFTDFVDGGTAANQDRRRQYLAICADLLTDHLQVMINEWSGNYKTTFLALEENKALDNMISSIAELSRSELAIERMAVALSNQDQEDEHSCFSDNTHRDIRLNLKGVANVYNGTYNNFTDAASLASLITEANAALGAELNTLLSTAIIQTNNTLIPFDLAIVNGATSTEGAKVQAAVQALVAFGDKLLEARVALGIN